jgi:fatty acid synthase
MGIRDIKSISLETTLSEMGMDSLMAVELKQIFDREFDINFSMQELRTLNFLKIMEIAQAREDSAVAESKPNANIFESLVKHLGVETGYDEILQYCSNENALEKKSDNGIGLIIPGMDGGPSDVMLNLCKSLNFPHFILRFNNAETNKAQNIDELLGIFDDVSS